MDLKPVEGKIILQFLEGETPEESANAGTPASEDAAVFALVLGAGPKTKVKKGQTVLVRAWARGGTRVDSKDENTVITDDYCVLAVVAV